MKIAIYGSAACKNLAILTKSRIIGRKIAKSGHIVITGACLGIPYEAAKAAFKAGGRVIGYSPALNRNKHVKKLNDPADCFSKMIFIPEAYKYKDNISACYKYRNINTAIDADKVIIIGGQFGTLNEFSLAYEMGKEIGVLLQSGGTADIIKLIENNLHKKTGARVYYHNNPIQLLKLMKIL